jgi:hypothetical protein
MPTDFNDPAVWLDNFDTATKTPRNPARTHQMTQTLLNVSQRPPKNLCKNTMLLDRWQNSVGKAQHSPKLPPGTRTGVLGLVTRVHLAMRTYGQ